MKSILVTGGCGLIGVNFIHYLLAAADFDGRVVNVDALTYAANPESLADLADAAGDRYVFVRADICDPAAMADVFDRFAIDAVCHFAAESHVDRSIARPDAFVRTNVMGTFTLLEAARRRQDRIVRFHHISTDEVFGSLGPVGRFTEETPYRPNSPYSASKAGSDHLVRAYVHTYGLPVTVTNCSNNYGPYQFPEKLIPLMILNAVDGAPLPVYGAGRNVRDWLYVTDHCRAIWAVMRRGTPGETYAVGGDCERTNMAVVEAICDRLDILRPRSGGASHRDLIRFVTDRPGHDLRYAIDFRKIRDQLGWTPTESFDTGLDKTIDWYLSHGRWVDRVRSGAYQEWMAAHYGDGRSTTAEMAP